MAEDYLDGLSKPKLKESPPEKLKKKGGRPKGSRVQYWLSPVEQEIVDLMCEGYKSNEIAKMTGRNLASVSSALERAKRKTGARSLYQLVTMAVRKKLKEGESDGSNDSSRGHRRGRGNTQDQEDRSVGASESSKATGTSTAA